MYDSDRNNATWAHTCNSSLCFLLLVTNFNSMHKWCMWKHVVLLILALLHFTCCGMRHLYQLGNYPLIGLKMSHNTQSWMSSEFYLATPYTLFEWTYCTYITPRITPRNVKSYVPLNWIVIFKSCQLKYNNI